MQIKVSGPLGLLSLFQSFKDRVPHKPGGGGGVDACQCRTFYYSSCSGLRSQVVKAPKL